jgi:hypothetical protein
MYPTTDPKVPDLPDSLRNLLVLLESTAIFNLGTDITGRFSALNDLARKS